MKSRSSLPIGVFDSGLGGLTVARELTRFLPYEDILYVGDTARVPYGTKSPDTIRRYALQIAFYLLQKKVKAIVVACNSASAVALKSLKDLPVPVVGVIEPGAKAAVLTTKSYRVGVIGTKATISSHAYRHAIERLSRKIKVWEQACPLFVPFVEEGWVKGAVTETVVSRYLEVLLKNRIDTLVLGCTHYPLLKESLQRVVGSSVKLIDSGEQTAKDVQRLLSQSSLLNPSKKIGKATYYVTDAPQSFATVGRQFFGQFLGRAQHLSLESI